jgi:hypothetical protein
MSATSCNLCNATHCAGAMRASRTRVPVRLGPTVPSAYSRAIAPSRRVLYRYCSHGLIIQWSPPRPAPPRPAAAPQDLHQWSAKVRFRITWSCPTRVVSPDVLVLSPDAGDRWTSGRGQAPRPASEMAAATIHRAGAGTQGWQGRGARGAEKERPRSKKVGALIFTKLRVALSRTLTSC